MNRGGEYVYHKKNKLKIKSNYSNENSYSKGVLLCSFAANNYFHFIFAAMTKLALINSISQFDDWPLFLDKKAYDISSLRELLGFLNKTNRNVIVIDEGEV